MKEDRDARYWDRKWALGHRLREDVSLDGSDGEHEFDKELLRRVRGKEALDVGCGPGEFTLEVAKVSRSVVGVDSSEVALRLARQNAAPSGLRNVEFRKGDSRLLPFAEGRFDLVYSRRGPASDTTRSVAEVFRVLRTGGTFMEITIGERDKRNLAEIFGRGQMLGFRGQVSAVKRRRLESVGFRGVIARDYMGTEIFRSLPDLMARLRNTPIIPSFDVRRDKRFLAEVKARCATERGIETPVHRVVLVAKK
jgi:SAM-dependent methyltransferase